MLTVRTTKPRGGSGSGGGGGGPASANHEGPPKKKQKQKASAGGGGGGGGGARSRTTTNAKATSWKHVKDPATMARSIMTGGAEDGVTRGTVTVAYSLMHLHTPSHSAAQQHKLGTTGMPSYTRRFTSSLYIDPICLMQSSLLLHPVVIPSSLLLSSFVLCTKGNVVHDQFAAAARIEAIDEGSVTFKGKAGSRCSVCIASAIRSVCIASAIRTCFVCASRPSLTLAQLCLILPHSTSRYFYVGTTYNLFFTVISLAKYHV